MSAVLERDGRFTEPLYTIAEAASYLRLSRQTFETWVHGYERDRPSGARTEGSPFIHSTHKAGVGRPELPFVGLAEGLIARAFKDAGVPIKELRAVLPMLQNEIGIEYALASRRVYVEGGRILFNYAKRVDNPELAVVRTQQGVLNEILAEYLRLVDFDRDGYVERFTLPGTRTEIVEVDPNVAFGKPVLIHGNARMVDLLDRFAAGDSLRDIAQDFEMDEGDLNELVRVFYAAER